MHRCSFLAVTEHFDAVRMVGSWAGSDVRGDAAVTGPHQGSWAWNPHYICLPHISYPSQGSQASGYSSSLDLWRGCGLCTQAATDMTLALLGSGFFTWKMGIKGDFLIIPVLLR